MADKMMRIAGRTSGGVAVPMLAETDGSIKTKRGWKKEWVSIEQNVEIRDTTAHKCPAIDVSDVPTFSLRILNRLGTPITLNFLTDVNQSNGYSLINMDGTKKAVTIQPSNSYIMITPEDVPLLNYIRYLRLEVTASAAPESGIFEACMVTVR
jgi:hypothetical protein